MGRQGWFLTLAILVALGLAGGGVAGEAAAAAPSPLLRIVHASSDAPAIDIYANGQKLATAPRFGDVAPYATLPAGTYTLRVLAAGAGPGGPAYLDTTADLREGQAYTIVAADQAVRMAPVFLTDTLGVAPDGKARVRLVHVSPDAPPVADVAVAGGPVVARNLPFKGATDYLAVAPGTYAFEIRPAGTTQALATTPPLALAADRAYTAFVMGQFGDNTFRAVIAEDNAATGGVGLAPRTGGGGLSAPSWPRPAGALAALLLLPLAALGYRRRRA